MLSLIINCNAFASSDNSSHFTSESEIHTCRVSTLSAYTSGNESGDSNLVKFSPTSTTSNAIESFVIPNENLFIPNSVGKMKVWHNENGFHILNGTNAKQSINRFDVDEELRNMSTTQLKRFLDVGYLSVSPIGDEDEYAIKAKVRGLGGGPIFGLITGIGVVAGIFVSAAVAVVAPPAAPAAAGVVYALAQTAPVTITAAFLAPTP